MEKNQEKSKQYIDESLSSLYAECAHKGHKSGGNQKTCVQNTGEPVPRSLNCVYSPVVFKECIRG